MTIPTTTSSTTRSRLVVRLAPYSPRYSRIPTTSSRQSSARSGALYFELPPTPVSTCAKLLRRTCKRRRAGGHQSGILFHCSTNGSIRRNRFLRGLDVEFRQIRRGSKQAVLLRCNGLNIGDRLTDNIDHPDFYRFHDVFHLAHAVYLGWSPIVRVLLNCKRKSNPRVDENQDGARARIIEEAVTAVVFSRAKETRFYDGVDHVDYDLLKTISEFVRGFEVENIPLWQWEAAILNGYRAFRALRDNGGGTVSADLINRELRYGAPSRTWTAGDVVESRAGQDT